MTTILLFANTGWYLYNHRRSLARAIQRAGIRVVLASPQDKYIQSLQAEGFTWHRLEVSRRGVNPFIEATSLLKCIQLYQRVRPSLVHHFTIKPVLYGSLAARLSGVPAVVNSITGLGYVFVTAGWRGRLLRALVAPLYRLALAGDRIRVIFQNHQHRQAFVTRGYVWEENTALIRGSGVDIDRFKPYPELDGPPVVVMAGRMLWDKGVGELVAAARKLKARGVPGKVVLVGEPDHGNPSSIPEGQLRVWHEEGSIEWIGQQEDMPSIYASSHIVVLPSYGEGLPLTLIEAAAAGKPIIATDIPGCREIVHHGENGLLVPVRDPEALAQALENLLRDPDTRRAMGQRGRELAVVEFSDKQVIRDTLEIYQDLLDEESRRL